MEVVQRKSTLPIDRLISNFVVHNRKPQHRHPEKGNFVEGLFFEKSKGQTDAHTYTHPQRLLPFSIDDKQKNI